MRPTATSTDGAKGEAERWLADYLTEQGAVSSKTAKADAAKAGIKERTLQRAVNSLGLVVESRGFPRVTWWRLANAASDASTPTPENLGATGATVNWATKGHCVSARHRQLRQSRQSRQDSETGATVDEHCQFCDAALEHPDSIAIGLCAECRLTAGGAA